MTLFLRQFVKILFNLIKRILKYFLYWLENNYIYFFYFFLFLLSFLLFNFSMTASYRLLSWAGGFSSFFTIYNIIIFKRLISLFTAIILLFRFFSPISKVLVFGLFLIVLIYIFIETGYVFFSDAGLFIVSIHIEAGDSYYFIQLSREMVILDLTFYIGIVLLLYRSVVVNKLIYNSYRLLIKILKFLLKL